MQTAFNIFALTQHYTLQHSSLSSHQTSHVTLQLIRWISPLLPQGLLISCNQMSAEYLFMTDKQYDISYDTGDKVIQCGRHNDIFKLWLQWRSKGNEGFERQQDRLMQLAEYQLKRIREQPDRFHLILEPELVNVSFWYIPKRLRGVPHDKRKEAELAKVSENKFVIYLIWVRISKTETD